LSAVQFAAASGGGSVTPSGVTDTLGLASATATLGPVAGTQTFTASVAGLANVTFSLTATSGILATITVTPNTVNLPTNGTQLFTAVGRDAGGNVVAITPTWSVVAGGGAINSAGLFTAGTVGGTFSNTVQATSGAISGTATVVVAAPLTTIAVAPGFSVLLTGGTVTLGVTGKDAVGATVAVTGLAFVSRSPAVATVNAATGLVTGVAGGTAVVVASATGGSGPVFDSMTVAVAGTGAAVASAIGDARAFDVVKAGDTVRVLVQVDLRRIAPDKLGSYNAELDWNATALRYVRTDSVPGGFVPPLPNETATASGQLRFGAANAAGSAGPTAGLATVVFVGNAVGTSPLTFMLTDLSGISPLFIRYLPAALIYSGTVRVQ
jgi:hypothetical protein